MRGRSICGGDGTVERDVVALAVPTTAKPASPAAGTGQTTVRRGGASAGRGELLRGECERRPPVKWWRGPLSVRGVFEGDRSSEAPWWAGSNAGRTAAPRRPARSTSSSVLSPVMSAALRRTGDSHSGSGSPGRGSVSRGRTRARSGAPSVARPGRVSRPGRTAGRRAARGDRPRLRPSTGPDTRRARGHTHGTSGSISRNSCGPCRGGRHRGPVVPGRRAPSTVRPSSAPEVHGNAGGSTPEPSPPPPPSD